MVFLGGLWVTMTGWDICSLNDELGLEGAECDYTLTMRLVLEEMDLIDSELLMKDKMGGYSRSMEITGVGVSDRLIDINFALIDFSYELDYSAVLGC